jgi:hypothetical protein
MRNLLSGDGYGYGFAVGIPRCRSEGRLRLRSGDSSLSLGRTVTRDVIPKKAFAAIAEKADEESPERRRLRIRLCSGDSSLSLGRTATALLRGFLAIARKDGYGSAQGIPRYRSE